MHSLNELEQQLANGTVRARTLVDEALDRIADPNGEGARAFISVAAESARTQADAVDRLRASGQKLPPFAGVPMSIKDLFDVAGEVTRAGSRILADQPPALRDAPVIARLRAAGFIFIGRNTMTEFAYSGLGANPHYGTPSSPFERNIGRLPGGSTSGGGVAVADGMAVACLGTDTGGSCRIPAAFCGLVGFKPTAHRVPRDGVIPLSYSLDSIGPIAADVSSCATLDAVLRGVTPRASQSTAPGEIRLLLPSSLVLNDMDEHVAKSFERGIEALARAGVTIVRQPLDDLLRVPELSAYGGISAYEAYAWHRPLLERGQDLYDPRVATRILKGRDISDQAVRELHDARAEVIASVELKTRDVDALVMPTTPIIAPRIAAIQQDPDYVRLNGLVLRNPSLANFLDRCAISLPVHRRGEAPVGLMLIGRRGDDERLFAIARAVESVLRG